MIYIELEKIYNRVSREVLYETLKKKDVL